MRLCKVGMGAGIELAGRRLRTPGGAGAAGAGQGGGIRFLRRGHDEVKPRPLGLMESIGSRLGVSRMNGPSPGLSMHAAKRCVLGLTGRIHPAANPSCTGRLVSGPGK